MSELVTRLVTRNRLFALDGAIFLPVGLIMLVAPSPEATMVSPAVPGSLPPLKATRRLLASQFVTVGLLMLAFAHAADRAAVRNLMAGSPRHAAPPHSSTCCNPHSRGD